ncbi:hypothetical protein EPS65_06215 [Helcococcus ovis]
MEDNNPAEAKREKGQCDKIGKAWKILALISVVVIVILTNIGTQLKAKFTDVLNALTKAKAN